MFRVWYQVFPESWRTIDGHQPYPEKQKEDFATKELAQARASVLRSLPGHVVTIEELAQRIRRNQTAGPGASKRELEALGMPEMRKRLTA